MPTALIGPAIGAAGSIFGNLIGGNAASKAAKQAAQTGQAVAAQYDKSTKDAINAGYYGMGQASDALTHGLAGAEGAYNNALAGQTGAIQGGLASATGSLQQAGAQARNDLNQKQLDANYAIYHGLDQATNRLDTSTQQANAALKDAYGQQQGYLNPYLQAGQQGIGQLAAFMGPGGQGQKQFDASMMESQDPGYAFRLAEGQKALDRSGAARGGQLGAAAAKEMARYSQDYASSEYQNAWQRYQQSQQQQFNMLSNLAGYGANAAGQAANAAGQYGAGQSGNLMGAGSQIANANLGAQGQIAQMAYGTGSQLANAGLGVGSGLAGYQYGGGRDIANANANWGSQVGSANLGTGGALANMQMAGNQWIGDTGLRGAQLAGNARMGAANTAAEGAAMKGNLWGQGIAGALGQIGGGITNYYNQQAGNGPTMINAGQVPAVMAPVTLGQGVGSTQLGPDFWTWGMNQPPAYKG